MRSSVDYSHIKTSATSPRPTLTAENAVEYLEWVMENLNRLPSTQVALHMQAAELAIRTSAAAAQAKATQHTLVESGVMDAPPAS